MSGDVRIAATCGVDSAFLRLGKAGERTRWWIGKWVFRWESVGPRDEDEMGESCPVEHQFSKTSEGIDGVGGSAPGPKVGSKGGKAFAFSIGEKRDIMKTQRIGLPPKTP